MGGERKEGGREGITLALPYTPDKKSWINTDMFPTHPVWLRPC